MAKKKKILWGRVFAFVGIILTAFVVFLVTTNSLPSTTSLRSMIKPRAATTKTLNVLEIRYFPSDPNGDQLSKTNALSSLLVTDIANASKPHGYKDANAMPVLQPVIKRVITRNKNTPYTTGTGETWYESLKTILTGDGENLCTYIVANSIDQVWLWKDVPNDNGGFNQERFLSWSNTMLPTGGYPPVCNGQRTFLFLGLDQNRTVGQALESFAHSIEDTAPVLMSSDLFWTRFTGGASGAVEARTCGNVHFPPNTSLAYDYTRGTGISTNCEDWHPDTTGTYTNVTCSRWGCTEEGYLIWWLQNLPHSSYGLTYNGKVIPTYTEFLADTDNAIRNAAASNQWLTAKYAAMATPGPTATPVATAYPQPLGVSYRCTPPQPKTATCNSTSTTCGKTCIDSSGATVATCAAGSDCMAQACHPIGDTNACTGTMNASCGFPCRADSDCSAGSICTVIIPANQPVITGRHEVMLKFNPTSSGQDMVFDSFQDDTGVIDNSSTSLVYAGTWLQETDSSPNNGTYSSSEVTGSSVAFVTRSSTVSFRTYRYGSRGKVDVYIDGVYSRSLTDLNTGSGWSDVSIVVTTGTAPTPTPAPTAAPTAAPTPTPAPGGSTITFNDLSGTGNTFSGIYPTGVVNWGTNMWYLSPPYGSFSTNSISFPSGGVTSRTFAFVTAKKLVSLQAYNGGTGSSTITIACSGNTTKSQSVAAGQVVTITTGFGTACTTVTIGSTNGWFANFDNLIYQ